MVGLDVTLYPLVLVLEACALIPAPLPTVYCAYVFVRWPQWFILATV